MCSCSGTIFSIFIVKLFGGKIELLALFFAVSVILITSSKIYGFIVEKL